MTQPKDFGFGEEEQMVRDSAAKFLKDNLPVEKLRTLVAKDHREAYESPTPPLHYDEALWAKVVELGWPALAVPESAGGIGMKMVAVAALAEQAGRAALPSPLIATLSATFALNAAATDTAAAWLERIANGQTASLAITDEAGTWEPEATGVEVRTEGDGAVLNGTAWFVQDARKASFFVVSASDGTGVGLYAVAADAPGVTIHPDHIVDLTRDQAHVRFDDVEVASAAIIVAPGQGAEALAEAWPAILTVIAGDLCGAAEWQLQTTAEYARTRTQFDHPIGFFQAVKHPIVNMMVEIDAARSLLYSAACAIDTEPEQAERYARMAKAAASDTAAFCSGRSVQLHGGIGFTWECDVHIYFKRQKHNELLFGDAAYQRARLAELLAA